MDYEVKCYFSSTSSKLELKQEENIGKLFSHNKTDDILFMMFIMKILLELLVNVHHILCKFS